MAVGWRRDGEEKGRTALPNRKLDTVAASLRPMSKAADPVHSNAQIFRVYLRRLSNPTDQDIFITSAKKLAVFLSNTRAYYAEAQRPVRLRVSSKHNPLTSWSLY